MEFMERFAHADNEMAMMAAALEMGVDRVVTLNQKLNL